MIREFATDEIARNRDEAPEYASWADEVTGTDRYIAMRLVRGLNLREERHVVIAERVFAAYGVMADIQGAAERARDFWARTRRVSEQHDYLGVQALKRLADRVEEMGLEPLLDSIPERA